MLGIERKADGGSCELSAKELNIVQVRISTMKYTTPLLVVSIVYRYDYGYILLTKTSLVLV